MMDNLLLPSVIAKDEALEWPMELPKRLLLLSIQQLIL